mmetsp:Transcript_285/g.367  ORF Transcript_285/g.367 Transcript_285/m.367 type:complete len:101 (-) Transcript_285:407-709(-)
MRVVGSPAEESSQGMAAFVVAAAAVVGLAVVVEAGVRGKEEACCCCRVGPVVAHSNKAMVGTAVVAAVLDTVEVLAAAALGQEEVAVVKAEQRVEAAALA